MHPCVCCWLFFFRCHKFYFIYCVSVASPSNTYLLQSRQCVRREIKAKNIDFCVVKAKVIWQYYTHIDCDNKSNCFNYYVDITAPTPLIDHMCVCMPLPHSCYCEACEVWMWQYNIRSYATHNTQSTCDEGCLAYFIYHVNGNDDEMLFYDFCKCSELDRITNTRTTAINAFASLIFIASRIAASKSAAVYRSYMYMNMPRVAAMAHPFSYAMPTLQWTPVDATNWRDSQPQLGYVPFWVICNTVVKIYLENTRGSFSIQPIASVHSNCCCDIYERPTDFCVPSSFHRRKNIFRAFGVELLK